MFPFVLLGVLVIAVLALRRKNDEPEPERPGGGVPPPPPPQDPGDLLGGGAPLDLTQLPAWARELLGQSSGTQAGLTAFGSPNTPGLPACADAFLRYRGVFEWPNSPADEDATKWPLIDEWRGRDQSLQDRRKIEDNIRRFWSGGFPHGVWALGTDCGDDKFVIYQVAKGSGVR